jgi:GMP synthase (glutamine-hydrolysing)
MPKSLPVLLVQLGQAPPPVRERFGDYQSWFERAWDGPMTEYDGRSGGRGPDPRNFAAVIVSGSRMSLANPEPWMDDAADLLRRAYDAGTPTLGICFGHQLIAYTFGGKVKRNPRGWEIGTCEVTLNPHGAADPLFDGLDSTLRVNLTHEDVVCPDSLVGSTLRNLATSELCDVQALAYGDHVRGVQFHPEISGAICSAYIDARRHLLTDRDPDALIARTRDSEQGVAVMRNFRRHFVERA